MKDFINKLKESNMIQFIYIGGGIVLACLILIIYFSYFYKGISYSDIKKKMESAAESYCSSNCEKLFDGVNSVTIPVSTLIDGGYIKELNKLTRDSKNSCSGEVIVTKGYSDYNYVSKLDCGNKYSDVSISDIVTRKNNYVTSGNGLYNMNDISIYRGDSVNNYIKLDGKDDTMYRIVKVNDDGSLMFILSDFSKLTLSVWDDRYNSTVGRNDGINDYSISRAKDGLEKLLSSSYKNSVGKKAIKYEYCIGSRKDSDSTNDGSIECSNKSSEYISLISVYDIINASLDSNCSSVLNSRSCTNYNYLNDYERDFWTVTSVEDTSNMVYRYNEYNIEDERAKRKHSLRFVFTISGDQNYKSGDGSLDNPYVLY